MNLKLNDKKKESINSTAGITLVALVVTIVVLLILAGISLNLVLGENGIIAKAKDAKDKSEQDIENTDIALNDLTDEMLAELGEEIPLGKVSVGEKASKNSTIDGNVGTATNPIIPKGYIPINTSTTSWGDGTSSQSAENVNKGLVITDSVDASGNSNGNEWVWVPVADASVMYATASTPIELTGGSGNTYLSGVNVSKYSKSINIINNDSSTVIISRGLPNSTSHREPDVVARSGSSYDAVDTNRATAGFKKADGTTMTLAEMADTMKSEYETMIASIEKYHGFYIGRYELSSAGVKKNQPTLTNTNWYQLYANCKNLSASDKAMTRMIWGCQWDVTCNWIANYGEQKDISDSRSWGNYSDSTDPANTGNYEQSVKKDTGSNEAWKANNIYDLAGNCWEWTQEAVNSFIRAKRGGYYDNSGSSYPASGRSINGKPTDDNGSDRRFSLHFNSTTLSARV